MTTKARIVVLISGAGTNLQAVLDACAAGQLAAQVVGVLSDRPAAGLERARRANVPAEVVPKAVARSSEPRAAYDAKVADRVADFSPDLVVLAGFMRILSAEFIARFSGRLINLHPALPGAFPGTHAIERAFAAKAPFTGVMVHHVVEEVDAGPVIAVERVLIRPSDTIDTLTSRIHKVEHALLVQAIDALLSQLGFQLAPRLDSP